jgi:hypothetical protein
MKKQFHFELQSILHSLLEYINVIYKVIFMEFVEGVHTLNERLN